MTPGTQVEHPHRFDNAGRATRVRPGAAAPIRRSWGIAPVGISRSRTFVPELESLRGIAILLVFTFHVHGFVLYPFPSASPQVSVPMAFATPWAWTLVTVLAAALLGVSTLTYRFIESPFLVRKARFDS